MSEKLDPGKPPGTGSGATSGSADGGLTAADRVRALAEGRLAEPAAGLVGAEIAADPALRAFYEEWLLVVEMTACVDVVPECTVAAPSVDAASAPSSSARRLRAVPASPRRRFAPWMSVAAAALVAAVVWGVATRDTGPVSIVAPELRGLVADASAVVTPEPGEPDAAVLERLASFEPSVAGKIAWIDDWEAATALARASGKPLLVYVHVDGCPYCAELDKNVWPDAAVKVAAGELIPARVDALKAPDRFADVFNLDTWPYVAVIDGDGETLHEFGGRRKATDMRAQITRGSEKATERRASRPSWDTVRRASKAVLRGDEARAAGRLGEALVAYRGGAGADASGDAPPARISAARARIVQGAARDALSKIVETARTDAARAATAAEEAAQRFSGSAVGAEFGALARTLRETGKVPSFEEAPK